ncbi:MAG: hypothetical protein K8R85_14500 [Bacteroidetes bacterium]|nr:hypothetical protein [Bacteroidota bacterium]
MKKIYTLIAGLMLTVSTFAQTPEKMSYQAVVRDPSNNLVSSQAIGMRISILQTTATGTAVYIETQNITSNANGLVTLEIGTGTVVSGNFTTIDWGNDIYFLKTETDPTGGINYTITGTSQLAVDTANWNNHTIDTQIDSTGIAALGFVAGSGSSQNIVQVLTQGNDAGTHDIVNIGTLGIGTSTPNLGAALEVSSTTGALLLPRMTTAQRDMISTKERGMIIFNTDVKKFQGYVADSTNNYTLTTGYAFPVQTASTSCLGGPGQSFKANYMNTNWAILEVDRCSTTDGIFTLTIYDGEGLGGTVLATQDVYLTNGINQIPLHTPLTLVAGQQYTFSFGIGPGLSYTSNTASYPDGTAYSTTSLWAGDLYFKILDGTVQYYNWIDLH